MNYLQRFISENERFESSRLSCLVAMFVIHGCISAPLMLFSMNSVGASDFQFFMCILLSMLVVVTNLAVMPLKITVPTFVISTLIFILMMSYNLFQVFL